MSGPGLKLDLAPGVYRLNERVEVHGGNDKRHSWIERKTFDAGCVFWVRHADDGAVVRTTIEPVAIRPEPDPPRSSPRSLHARWSRRAEITVARNGVPLTHGDTLRVVTQLVPHLVPETDPVRLFGWSLREAYGLDLNDVAERIVAHTLRSGKVGVDDAMATVRAFLDDDCERAEKEQAEAEAAAQKEETE